MVQWQNQKVLFQNSTLVRVPCFAVPLPHVLLQIVWPPKVSRYRNLESPVFVPMSERTENNLQSCFEKKPQQSNAAGQPKENISSLLKVRGEWAMGHC